MYRISIAVSVFFFISLTSFSQEKLKTDKIEDKLEDYNATFPYQDIYVQTDKNYYEVGERIWLKAYLRYGKDKLPDTVSTNLYIDFINWKNKIVATKFLRVKEGVAFADYHIPDSLAEGTYKLRAYTNYMRNFPHDFFYTKSIYIKNSDPQFFTMKDYNLLKKHNRKLQRNEKRYDIQFFPEGGYLVAGIESNVAFKAIDDLEKGVEVEGLLLNSKGDELLSFESSHKGMGTFRFKPEKGEKYKVKLVFEDRKKRKYDLPETQNYGFVLKKSEDSENFIFSVEAKLPETNDKVISDYFLVIHNAGKLLYVNKYNFYESKNILKIKKNELPTGVNQISLISGNLKPKCERLFYVKGCVQKNIQFSELKKRQKTKEKSDLEIFTPESPLFNYESNLAVSVVNIEDFSQNWIKTENICQYFSLESYLRGRIEDISYYFSGKTEEVSANLDLLLMTQGWRRYNWETINADSLNVNYQNEHLISVSGQITRDLLGIPIKDIKVRMSLLNKYNEEFETKTDDKGRFIFSDLDYSDTLEVLIEARKKSGRKNLVFYLDIDSVIVKDYQIKPEISPKIYATKGRMQKRVKYPAPNERVWEEGQPQDKPIHGTPDQIIYLDKISYSPTATVEQVVKQYVPGFYGSGASANFRGVSSIIGSSVPHLLLDGVGMHYSMINDIPIQDVARIEILKGSSAAIYGIKGATGVIAVYTKTGRYMKRGEIQFNMLGYATPKEFYSPKYESPESKKGKDLRKTIYWNPQIILKPGEKHRVEYYNSDLKGKVLITVEGIDENGNPLHVSEIYEVE